MIGVLNVLLILVSILFVVVVVINLVRGDG